jgi:cytochrome b involved in lipid metabolism
MTSENFINSVRRGKQLVILDNLVLDVGEYVNYHPGGKFVLRHNVGQDISKFFFGGYCLEDNIPRAAAGHNHSSYARKIVN